MSVDHSAMTPTEVRLGLFRTGYRPLPLNGKSPEVNGKGWQQKRLETNEGEIRLWETMWPYAVNTGVLTRYTPFLDLDIRNPEAADAAAQLVAERFDGHYVLSRFGNAPKRAIPFQTATPFQKITVVLINPNEPDPTKQEERIEVLSDGQQVVVHGIHPDTQRPYSWHGGAIWDVHRDDLPGITAEQARQLVDDIAELLVNSFGYLRKDAARGDPKTWSHVWRSKDFDFPCTPTGVEYRNDPDGRIYAQVRSVDGTSFVPKDELVPAQSGKAGNGADPSAAFGEFEWTLTPESLIDHDRLAAGVMALLKSGMSDGACVNFLRSSVGSLTGVDPDRKQRRLNEIPSMVRSARAKIDAEAARPPIELGEWSAGMDRGPIKPRPWLLGNQFCRGYISSLFAAGGVGKSALRLLQLMSMALDRPLCGQRVFRRSRVLLISLEDNDDELQRRIQAVLLHYGIERSELEGWMWCSTPIGRKIALQDHNKRVVGDLEKSIREAIERRKPDIVALDPFIKLHSLEENDSGDMNFVCDLLMKIATESDIAVDILHHVHKGQIAPGDADAGRGSSGIRDAGRLIYTLTVMSENEAKSFNISPDERFGYVRLDSAKVNIASRATAATWFRIIGVDIGNGTSEYPAGDTVQVAEPWKPPDAWSDLSNHTLNTILDAIDAGCVDEDNHPTGERFSNAPAATDRAVWPVVLKFAPDKSEAQCRTIIHAWLRSGLLFVKTL